MYNADSGKCLEEAGHAAEEREVIEKRAASRGGGSIAAGILGGLLLLGKGEGVAHAARPQPRAPASAPRVARAALLLLCRLHATPAHRWR